MTLLTPHQINYPKGRVDGIGLFLEHESPFVTNHNNTIIEHWQPGSRLYKTPNGLILLWPTEQSLYVSQCPGNVLIKQENVISNTILSESILNKYDESREQFVIDSQGTRQTLFISQCDRIPEATLLDVSGWSLVTLSPLINKAKAPQLQQKLVSSNLRNVMADQDLKASKVLTSQLDKLKNIQPRSGRETSAMTSFIAGAKGAMKGLKEVLTKDDSGEASVDEYGKTVPKPGLIDKIKNTISQNIMMSKLGDAIGRQQAKHMQNMLDMFKQGDLNQALKNAVPLANMRDAMQTARPSFGRPGSRSSLNINTHSTGSGVGFDLEASMLEKMRQVYRAAFKKLDQAGQYQKAAFVLAELLREIDKAVDYLEKHQEFRLAALLAEGQKLTAARVIRQWVLADDIERAIQIAKISGCFEQAITALSKDHLSAANKLRWELAKQHADAGDYLTACELAWPLTEKRAKIIDWMKQTIDFADRSSAISLLRLANFYAASSLSEKSDIEESPIEKDENKEIHTQNSHPYLEQLHDLIMQDSPIRETIRSAVIDEILNTGKSYANKIMANLMVRLYLQNVTAGQIRHTPATWQTLLDISENQALRADARNLVIKSAVTMTPLYMVSQPIDMTFPPAHGRSISDVALLSNGWFLVAFGESGVELWSHTGKKKNAWFVPCQQIILSDLGNQALLLTGRGTTLSIHTFSLLTLQAEFWQDIALDNWANSYDGMTWMVSKEHTVWALDVTNKENSAIWSVSDLGGPVVGIKRAVDYLSLALKITAGFEIWVYKLPDLFLKERTPYSQNKFEKIVPIDFDSRGNFLIQDGDTRHRLCLTKEIIPEKWYDAEESILPQPIQLFYSWLSYCTQPEPDAITLNLINVQGKRINQPRLHLHCQQCKEVQLKIHDNNIIVWTNNGMIISIDGNTSTMKSNIVV